VYGAPQARALAGVEFIITDFSQNLVAFATVQHIFHPLAVLHFSAISTRELTTLLLCRPLSQETLFPRPEKWTPLTQTAGAILPGKKRSV
jgi:hypothetical protein